MKKHILTSVVVALVVAVAVLAFAVEHKMSETAVNDMAIAPIPTVVDTSSPPPDTTAPTAVFIGDFTKGTDDGGLGDNNWTSILVADAQPVTPLRSIAVGEGSGYVIRSSAPTFADQVRRFVKPNDRVVVITGSRNDVVADPAEVGVAAMETYQLVHSLAPDASLIVVGPTWGASDPTPEVLATRDAVKQAALDAGAYFVDPIELNWLTSGEPGLVGPDNVHPTDLANKRIAESMSAVFAQALTESRNR
jgi:hypothetical protein